jgi:hypothetical protein
MRKIILYGIGMMILTGASPCLAQYASPVSDAELSKVVGKADLAQTVRANNSAILTNNQVNGNSVTGGITIDGQALSNLNGLAIISANTGNNVAINSSLNVNVSLHP